jgi:hypothetical protein
MKEFEPIQPDWKWATPEGGRTLDRLLDSRLSFREILIWQEEAESLSLRLQAQREAAKKERLSKKHSYA